MRGVYRTRRFTNPLNNLRPIEYEMATKIENWHRIRTAAANLFSHPTHIGMQTACDFFNRDKFVFGAAARNSRSENNLLATWRG